MEFVALAEPSMDFARIENRLPNVCRRRGFDRQADFVIEGYVDPRAPLRNEGPFGDHTGPRDLRR